MASIDAGEKRKWAAAKKNHPAVKRMCQITD
jgi:hypothetical protein